MRKNWKKIVSLLLAASMAMSMNVATFAEEIHEEVAEAVVEEAVEADNTLSGSSTSEDAIAVSESTVSCGSYVVKVSYNKVVSFTGKKLTADVLQATATVSGGDIKKATKVDLRGKFAKSDVVKGKATGEAKFVLTGLKAVKGADKDTKKAVKVAAKAVKNAKKDLAVTVKPLSLSANGVSANLAKKSKDAKAQFEKNKNLNYIVAVAKYNEKKPEKSKVVVFSRQTKANGKIKAVQATLKNGKNGFSFKVVSGNLVLAGPVSGNVAAK